MLSSISWSYKLNLWTSIYSMDVYVPQWQCWCCSWCEIRKIKCGNRKIKHLPKWATYPPLPSFPYRKVPKLLTACTDRMGFLTSFDIYNCEEPNPSITIHTPFLSLTVWLAAVVHEPSVIALWASVNDSILELQKSTFNNCHSPLKPLQQRYRCANEVFFSSDKRNTQDIWSLDIRTSCKAPEYANRF